MILVFYLVINAIAILMFAKQKKKLHFLEIMSYWMVASYLIQNFSALAIMNFKTLTVLENLGYEFAHFLNRTVLYPLLIVTFLNFYLVLSTFMKKLGLIVGAVIFLVGLEWLADVLRVQIHVNWQLWWSFTIWLTVLLVSIAFMTFFRKILYKGVLNS